jgi:hypothetical protein
MTIVHYGEDEILSGPIYIQYKQHTFFANGGLTIKLYEKKCDIGNSILGFKKELVGGRLLHISFVPMISPNEAGWNKLYQLMAFDVGNSMLSDTDNILYLYFGDGEVMELNNATIIKMPSMHFYGNELRLNTIEFEGTLSGKSKRTIECQNLGVLLDALPGAFSCQWGSEAPWRHFYPLYGLDIHFETYMEPVWSFENNSLVDYIFRGIEIRVVLKMRIIPDVSLLFEKINDLIINIHSELSAGQIKIERLSLCDFNYRNHEKAGVHLILKTQKEKFSGTKLPIFSINLNSRFL